VCRSPRKRLRHKTDSGEGSSGGVESSSSASAALCDSGRNGLMKSLAHGLHKTEACDDVSDGPRQ
jgi:hypothetical protein